jgi:hypothetical protein
MLLPFDIARILPRGLLGFMDDQDEPEVPLGTDEERAPVANGLVPHDIKGPILSPEDRLMQELRRRAVERAMQLRAASEAAVNFLGRTGVRPPTYDPVTGTPIVSNYLSDIGRLFSENMPLPGLPGARPRGPTTTGPVTSLPRSEPRFLFGGPQAETAENQVYLVPPADEFGEDETTDDCVESWEEDMDECGERFGYAKDSFARCAERAGIRLSQCKSGVPRRLRMRRWSDMDEEGWRPPRLPKGRSTKSRKRFL